jgi:hypothetical protein
MRNPDTCFDRSDGSHSAGVILRASTVVPIGFLFDVLWSVIAPDLRLEFVATKAPEIECGFEAKFTADRQRVRIEIARATTGDPPANDANVTAVTLHVNALLASPAVCVEQIARRVRERLAADRASVATDTCRPQRGRTRRASVLALLSQAVIASAHGVGIAPFDLGTKSQGDLIAA